MKENVPGSVPDGPELWLEFRSAEHASMWPFRRRRPPPGLVLITVIDAANGRRLADGHCDPNRLPESFARETVFHFRDEALLVVRADPLTRDQIVSEGRATLTVRRATVDAPSWRIDGMPVAFRLPTIHRSMPHFGASPGPIDSGLRLHGDDWRQIEFVSKELVGVVFAEFTAIRRLFDLKRGEGFTGLHERLQPEQPLVGIRRSTLTVEQHLAAERLGGFWLDDPIGKRGAVAGGASFRTPGGQTGYWVEEDGVLTVLGLADPRGMLAFAGATPAKLDLGEDLPRVAEFAKECGLFLVDWCTTTIVCDGS